MIDDANLGAASRALLDAARPGLAPDADAARRMRARIAVAVAGPAVGTAAVKPALAAKLGLASLVAVVVVGAIVFATRRDPEPAVTPTPVVAPVAPVGAAPHPVPVVATVAPPVAVEQDMPEVAIGKTRDERRRAATTPGATRPEAGQSGPATPAKSTISLAREVQLIDGAMASLRKGEARAALVAIRTYDSETAGTGQLAEDAAAIQVEALCALKDPSAVTRLATFDQRYPRSAQRSRLATCAAR